MNSWKLTVFFGRQPLIAEAAKHYAAYLERQKTMHAPVKFPAVVDDSSRQSNKRTFRPYVEDCTSRLSKQLKHFVDTSKGSPLRILKRGSIPSRLLAGRAITIAPRSAPCSQFARSRGYLPRSERTEAELTMKASDRGGDIGIYTPKELAVMLTGIEAKFMPLVALGGFAGLRTAEIHRLAWEDIDLHGGHIVVGKQKSKTGQRRIVPILPVLRAWLEPHAKATGPVIPRYSGDAPLLRAFRQALDL